MTIGADSDPLGPQTDGEIVISDNANGPRFTAPDHWPAEGTFLVGVQERVARKNRFYGVEAPTG